MKSRPFGVGIAVVAVLVSLQPEAYARDLTFEDRVKAQEAIDRVYYSHQIGATKPFEEAVPREVLEKKVRTRPVGADRPHGHPDWRPHGGAGRRLSGARYGW